MRLLLPFTALAPLLAALVVAAAARNARQAGTVAALAPLPALALAAGGSPGTSLRLPWLLLGTELHLDDLGRVLLLVSALVWIAAALSARVSLAGDARYQRFFFAFLLTMAGNLGLPVAGDVPGFYLAFALMTFSAYGMVVHDGTPFAVRAGRVYVTMAVFGEAMLLVAFLLAVNAAGSIAVSDVPAGVAGAAQRDLIVALTLAGFGIKAGAPLLHLWLPLAHPAAPVPASAVLSGAIIKAGLLGWLRFLPLGEAALPGWGTLCVAAGLAAAFGAAAVGATQSKPKINLAYSSVSQMGTMLLLVGLALADPGAWRVAAAVAIAFALHHGLAKGALFLGVGVAHAGGGLRTVAVMALPALALAGGPLTSGSAAKGLVKLAKQAAEGTPAGWDPWLDPALSLTAAATTVLMVRLVQLMAAEAHGGAVPAAAWVPWAALLAGVATLGAVVPGAWLEDLGPVALLAPATLWTATWPVLVGGALGAATAALARRRRLPELPPGDLVVVAEGVAAAAVRTWRRRLLPRWEDATRSAASRLAAAWAGARRRLQAAEAGLADGSAAGILFVGLALALLVLLA